MSHNTTRQQISLSIETINMFQDSVNLPAPQEWVAALREIIQFLDMGGTLVEGDKLYAAYNMALDSNCYLFARGLAWQAVVNNNHELDPSNYNLEKMQSLADFKDNDFTNGVGLAEALEADGVKKFSDIAIADISNKYPILVFKTSNFDDYHFVVPALNAQNDMCFIQKLSCESENNIQQADNILELNQQWGIWGEPNNYQLAGVFYANKNDIGTKIVPNAQGKPKIIKPTT